MTISIELYRDLSAAKKDWESTVEASGTENIFASYDWVNTWWTATKGGRARCGPWILCAHEGRRPVAVAPLMLTHQFGLRVLEFMGVNYAGYSEIVAVDDRREILDGVFTWLRGARARWDLAFLRELSLPGDGLDVVINSANAAGLRTHASSQYEHALVDTTGTWQDFTQKSKRMKKIFKKNRNRVRKLSKEQGKIEIVKHVDFGDDRRRGEILEEIAEIERRSWKHEEGTSLLCTEQCWAFHKNLVRPMREANAEIWTLRLDGRAICYTLGIEYRKRYFYFVTSYDNAFRTYGVGMMLQKEVFEDCFERGVTAVDFVPGNEPDEKHWASTVKPSYQLAISHRGVRSYLAHQLYTQVRQQAQNSKVLQQIRALISS